MPRSRELVVSSETDFIRDARFAPAGGPLYVATRDRNAAHDEPEESALLAIDRTTGDVLREATVSGIITAIAAPGDRLWIARTRGTSFGGELFVDLLDPETLELRRSIAVAADLAPAIDRLWPNHGDVPVLLEDGTGTRLTYTGAAYRLRGLVVARGGGGVRGATRSSSSSRSPSGFRDSQAILSLRGLSLRDQGSRGSGIEIAVSNGLSVVSTRLASHYSCFDGSFTACFAEMIAEMIPVFRQWSTNEV